MAKPKKKKMWTIIASISVVMVLFVANAYLFIDNWNLFELIAITFVQTLLMGTFLLILTFINSLENEEEL